MDIPNSFEHFEILKREDGSLWELGRGSMGITYKARDTRLNTIVALKIVSPEITKYEDAVRRFLREAQAAAKLQHPNIATVRHFGEVGKFAFYVMEYCDGPTIQQMVVDRGPVSEYESLSFALQIARALSCAEQHQLLHRDLKPSNLILTSLPDGTQPVKVIDFGLACGYGTNNIDGFATQTSSFTGTVWFASPEQLREESLDIRSDFYSLGACLWYMLTGKRVFEGTFADVLAGTLKEKPNFEELSGVSSEYKVLLGHLLAKDKSERPTSAITLCFEIEGCMRVITALGGGVEATGDLRRSLGGLRLDEDLAGNHEDDGILSRFETIREIRRTAHSVIKQGNDLVNQKLVEIRVASGPVLDVPEYIRKWERHLQQMRLHPFNGILPVHFYGKDDGGFLVVTGPFPAITLFDVLRTRGVLEAGEAIKLLKSIAVAVDHACTHFTAAPMLRLHSVGLSLKEGEDPKRVLKRAIVDWPEWSTVLDLCEYEDGGMDDLDRSISAMHTVVAGQTAEPIQKQQSAVEAVSRLLIELLGGRLQNSGRFAPLSRISLESNRLLCEASSATQTAREWLEQFERSVGVEIESKRANVTRRHEGPPRKGTENRTRLWIFGLALMPVGLALGWLGLTLWQRRHKEDPRAFEKTVSRLEEIRDLGNAMKMRADEVQNKRFYKAKALEEMQKDPQGDWDKDVGNLEGAIKRGISIFNEDRSKIERSQDTLLDWWEDFPSSYEAALAAVRQSAKESGSFEIDDLATRFIERIEELRKNPDRKMGRADFLNRICPMNLLKEIN